MKTWLTSRQRFEIGEYCKMQLRRFERKSKLSSADENEQEFYMEFYDKMRIHEIAINELPRVTRRKIKS